MRIPIAPAVLMLTAALSLPAGAQTKKDIVYAKPGGTELKLDFYRPAGDGPFPLVVCIHGGAWREGKRGDFHMFCNWLAGEGFATVTIQYRFCPKHKFPAQLDDVRAALAYLRENAAQYAIRPDRVAFFGGSAGGHLSLLAGLGDPPKGTLPVQAVINLAGPTDFRSWKVPETGEAALKGHTGKGVDALLADFLGTSDRSADVYAQVSPINHIKAGSPPVLSINGTNDPLVPDQQARVLHDALRKAGVKEKLMLIENGGHDLNTWPKEALGQTLFAVKTFLNEHLKK